MSELTREQIEEAFDAVYWHGDQQGTKQREVLDGVDTLRATVEQQAQAMTQLEGERDEAQRSETHWFQVATDDGAALAECRQQLAAMTRERDEWESKEQAVKKSNAQLQATLAAREERIQETEEFAEKELKPFTTLDEAKRIIKELQCSRFHRLVAYRERDAAVQEAARLRARIRELNLDLELEA